jgi:hypothetical protein
VTNSVFIAQKFLFDCRCSGMIQSARTTTRQIPAHSTVALQFLSPLVSFQSVLVMSSADRSRNTRCREGHLFDLYTYRQSDNGSATQNTMSTFYDYVMGSIFKYSYRFSSKNLPHRLLSIMLHIGRGMWTYILTMTVKVGIIL